MVPASMVSSIVAEALKAFAAQSTPAPVAEAPKVEVSVTTTPAEQPDQTDSRGRLFGNQDKDKDFDLAKLLPGLTALPSNKVIIAILKHMKQSDGTAVEDKSARRIQVVEVADYKANTTPDKDSGVSVYDTLFGTPGSGGGFKLLHKPE